MKKSALFILLIGATLLFCSCGKDYDYRDKWVGEYQCKIITITHYTSYVTTEDKKTIPVTKNGENGIVISSNIYAHVLEDGTIHPDGAGEFSGSFKKPDSLFFIYTIRSPGGVSVQNHYYCKKIK